MLDNKDFELPPEMVDVEIREEGISQVDSPPLTMFVQQSEKEKSPQQTDMIKLESVQQQTSKSSFKAANQASPKPLTSSNNGAVTKLKG